MYFLDYSFLFLCVSFLFLPPPLHFIRPFHSMVTLSEYLLAHLWASDICRISFLAKHILRPLPNQSSWRHYPCGNPPFLPLPMPSWESATRWQPSLSLCFCGFPAFFKPEPSHVHGQGLLFTRMSHGEKASSLTVGRGKRFPLTVL